MKNKSNGKISVMTEKDYEDYISKLTNGQKLDIPIENKD